MKILALFLLSLIFTMLVNIPQAKAKSNFERTGDITQILIPACAFSTTIIINDDKGRNQFIKSFLTNFAVTYLLKYAINKPRQENNGDYSFPSGHTAAAFQGARFIHKRYGNKFGIPAYIAAGFVGWSRVEGESDKHDFFDVTAGALIGILSSSYFTSPYKHFSVTPVGNKNSTGVSLNYNW